MLLTNSHVFLGLAAVAWYGLGAALMGEAAGKLATFSRETLQVSAVVGVDLSGPIPSAPCRSLPCRAREGCSCACMCSRRALSSSRP